MKKHYLKKMIALSLFMAGTGAASAQVQYNVLNGFGVAVYDINSQGQGIHGNGYYDFETNSSTPTESDVASTLAINDAGQVIGELMSEDGMTYYPAFKDNGEWSLLPSTAFDLENFTYILYDISENGQYIAGQRSTPDFSEAWGFIYNVETETMTVLSSDLYEYGAAYAVNNNGVAAGWVDDLPEGTVRMPAAFFADGTIELISENPGEASGVNNQNLVVGNVEANAFIYNLDTEELSTFTPVSGQDAVTFTDISENGVAVGYGSQMFDRFPVIYHEILGSNLQLLSTVLAQFGIDATDLVGTAYRISSDGNYIAGWGNGPAFMAPGWAIYFDDMLLIQSECTINCIENITVDAVLGEASAIVEYDMSYTCENEEPEGLQLVLVNGLESGSDFPIGTTTIFHQLIDSEGEVMNSCSFTVTVNDAYCTPGYDVTEPISYISFAGIENQTSAELNTQPTNEYFLDMEGTVEQGETYEIIVEGNTGGDYTNYFSAFIDWNQDGDFDEGNELYLLGALTGSTGMDGQQVISNIAVPDDALTGPTRLRVVKNYNDSPTDPCGMYSYGQTEEYTVVVEEGTTGIAEANSPEVVLFPNPVEDVLHIRSSAPVRNVTVTNIVGQTVLELNNIENNQVNTASLVPGVYLITVETTNSKRVVRIVKN